MGLWKADDGRKLVNFKEIHLPQIYDAGTGRLCNRNVRLDVIGRLHELLLRRLHLVLQAKCRHYRAQFGENYNFV